MFPECRALLAAPLSDSEEQWVGVDANCDLLQCPMPQLGGRYWDVSVPGMRLKFATVLVHSREMLQAWLCIANTGAAPSSFLGSYWWFWGDAGMYWLGGCWRELCATSVQHRQCLVRGAGVVTPGCVTGPGCVWARAREGHLEPPQAG